MDIKITEQPKSTVELIIKVSVNEFKPYLNKAAEKISQEQKIPGFRPGKVPYDILKQRVGEMTIWQEAAEIAISHTFWQAVQEKKLETIGPPKIAIQKLAPNNPLVYKATVALLPKVKLADYKKLKVKRREVKVKDEEVTKTLKDLQKMHAKETLVDRTIGQGDKAVIDLTLSQDKVPLENGKTKNFSVTVGQDWLVPGFSKNLVGLKKDETKKFQLKFPEKHFDKKLAGKLIDFEVKVNSIYEVSLPEMNDELAQSLGNLKTLEDLQAQIRKNLEDQAKMKEDQRFELEILEKLIQISNFEEIPDVLLENEKEKMLMELETSITGQNLKFEDYLSHIKKTKEQLKKEFAPKAEKRVKTALAIRQIAQQEDIKIDNKTVNQEIEKSLETYKDKPDVQKKVRSEAYQNYLRNILATRKVIEYLKKQI
jgi:trigger factor